LNPLVKLKHLNNFLILLINISHIIKSAESELIPKQEVQDVSIDHGQVAMTKLHLVYEFIFRDIKALQIAKLCCFVLSIFMGEVVDVVFLK